MDLSDFISEYGLYAGYILVVVAAISAIILPLINAISNPRSLLKGLVGLVFIGIIFIIGYTLANNEVLETYITFGVDEAASKLIGGALISMYILILLAIIGIVITEVTKIFQ